MKTDMEYIVKDLGKIYKSYKLYEKKFKGDSATKKNRVLGIKERFLNEATNLVSDSLARKTVEFLGDKLEAEHQAHHRYPEWIILDIKQEGDTWKVLLEEDPKYKTYSYVDKNNELVWTKQVVNTSPYIDDEELYEKDPELWDRITVLTRTMQPLDSLYPEDLAEVQKYMYPGSLQVKLAAPRAAKPEELE